MDIKCCQHWSMRGAATRSWRGTSAEERRNQRRAALVSAGLEVIGTEGWSRTTVRGVCLEAGLTERYFYEAFADRDALLLAVFELVRDQTLAAVVESIAATAGEDLRTRTRAAIEAGLVVLTDDPRRGRVFFLEAAYNEALQKSRHEDTVRTAQLLGQIAQESLGLEAPDAADVELSALAIVGAESALAAAYLAGHVDVTRERLIEHLTELHLATARITSAQVRP